MAKSRGSNRGKSKPSAKVQDLSPKNSPKGGGVFVKLETPGATIKLGDGSVVPNPAQLNFKK